MKKIFTLMAVMLLTLSAAAQAPAKMSYQSVIRDSKGSLITDQKVTVQISVLKGTREGEAVYIENHAANTNANGLVSLEIGGGEIVKGKFSDINWSDGTYFIKTGTDAKGGTSFDIVGVSEFLSVPYALSARTAENAFSGNYNDLKNKPTKISEFINDMGYTTTANVLHRATDVGVPSQNWSLFGNRSSNALTDKLGTTDNQDLVIVTNNIDRLRIKASGDINLRKSLEIGEDLNVNKNVTLNILGGETNNKGKFSVTNASATNLTGTLNVVQATTLQSTLDVKNMAATRLTGILTVDKATTLQSTLDVNNMAATHLTGLLDVDTTLNVDGATALQSTLDVNNMAATHLTGLLDVDKTLNVDGATTLQSTLDVNNMAATHLTGLLDVDKTLNVDGATTLQSTLDVNNMAATHLTGVLTVDKQTTINANLNANGQVTVKANLAGTDGAYDAYPLRVQGSAQGIAIKLNAGTPDTSNNFVTFFNNAGNAVGRIEGEVSGDVDDDPEFIFDEAILVAEEAKAIAAVPLAAIPVAVAGAVVSAGPCGACIAMAAADLILASANLAAYNIFAYENLGVTYQSGSADYAEWLERSNPAERITAGDIVGVNAGKISKNTSTAQHYMVISTKPAILGNMPDPGQEKSYEKVAFMGQIPAKVRGIVVAGDYILPSGLNDGTGIAVSADDIKAEQYRNIVGIAWSNALISGSVSTINMAIGLNTNDIANLAAQQEKKIAALEQKFSNIEQRLLALENGTSIAPSKAEIPAPAAAAPKLPTRNELIAATMPAELNAQVMEDAFAYLENSYKRQGVNVKNHPGLNKLFTDATFKAEIIRKTQENYKASYQSMKNKN